MARLAVKGILVHFEDTGRSESPVVVMSNSLAADLSMWEPQATFLARKYRVIRFDARGHGETQGTEGEYSLDLLTDDVLDLMDVLGVDRFHFVGLSLGGMIGQVLALRAPERLISLVLCATFASADPDLWNRRAAAILERGLDEIVEPTVVRWLTPAFRSRHPEVAERVRAMILRTSAAGYAGCAAAIRDMNLANVPERIAVPTLLIAAAGDPSATPELMSELHGRIMGSRIETIPDAAHLFTLERPETTNKLLMGFLNEVDSVKGRGRGFTERHCPTAK